MLFQELSCAQVLGLVSTVKLEPAEQTKWTVVHRRNICTERHKFHCSYLLIRNRAEIFKESRIVQTSEKTRKSGKKIEIFCRIYNIMGWLSLTSVLVDPLPLPPSEFVSFFLPPPPYPLADVIFGRPLVNKSYPKHIWIREQSIERTIWSITFTSARCRFWSLKRPISRHYELDRYVRKPPKNILLRHWFRLVIVHENFCFQLHRITDSYSVCGGYSPGFWFVSVLHGMDCSTGQDRANFEEPIADEKISSLSKCNHKLVTELTEVAWHACFSSVSEVHYF